MKLVGEGRAEETFERWARDWHEQHKERWKPVHADDVITSMERDLFPVIGGYPATGIDEPLLLATLKVEKRGAIETARRPRQRAERVFKFAKAAGAGSANPSVDVREAMAVPKKKRRWPAITDFDRLRGFVADADADAAGASPVTRLASRFLGLTAQRPRYAAAPALVRYRERGLVQAGRVRSRCRLARAWRAHEAGVRPARG